MLSGQSNVAFHWLEWTIHFKNLLTFMWLALITTMDMLPGFPPITENISPGNIQVNIQENFQV